MKAKTCQIHVEADDRSHSFTRRCGRPATWWSDDLDDTTTWMCDRCCADVLRDADSVEAHDTREAAE